MKLIAAATAGLVIAANVAAQQPIDRIAAVIDQQVITLSEVDQMEETRFFPRTAVSQDDYRRRILDELIAQALRLRDMQRFGLQDVPKDSIEPRVQEIQKRFASPAEFATALQHAELTPDELRALVKRQLQVERYIQDRFAPLIFVPNEDIQKYYKTTWSQQRRERGLSIPPLPDVREEIRTLLKSSSLQKEIDDWTAQLRARSNVDILTWRKE
jgi:peptidyl-prolyl cis-trans isomerase SurA